MIRNILRRVAFASILAAGVSGVILRAQDLLDQAAKLTDLTVDEPGPFELDADFTAQVNKPLEGHFAFKWKSSDAWWRKITLGPFEEIEIRKGDWLYTSRNVKFEPQRVQELKVLLEFAEHYGHSSATVEKKKKVNGSEAICVETAYPPSSAKGPEVCIDPISKEVIQETQSGPMEQGTRREFSDYITLGNHRFPSNLKLREGASVILSVHVTSLSATTFDDGLLTPTAGAIQRRQCAGMKAPMLIQRPPAQDLKLNGSGGLTSLWITIGTDGSVIDAQLIGHSTEEMDEKIIASIRSWKYRPAMCGNEPVVADEMVSIGIQKR